MVHTWEQNCMLVSQSSERSQTYFNNCQRLVQQGALFSSNRGVSKTLMIRQGSHIGSTSTTCTFLHWTNAQLQYCVLDYITAVQGWSLILQYCSSLLQYCHIGSTSITCRFLHCTLAILQVCTRHEIFHTLYTGPTFGNRISHKNILVSWFFTKCFGSWSWA